MNKIYKEIEKLPEAEIAEITKKLMDRRIAIVDSALNKAEDSLPEMFTEYNKLAQELGLDTISDIIMSLFDESGGRSGHHCLYAESDGTFKYWYTSSC